MLIFSIFASFAVALTAYVVANRRLHYRHNGLQFQILASFALSVVFGKLLTLEHLRNAGTTTSLLRLAGFVAAMTMFVAATHFVRTLRAERQELLS